MNSVSRLISGGAMPLGSLGGGLLIEGIGTIRTLLVLAAVRLLLALVGTLSRGLHVDPTVLPVELSAAPQAGPGECRDSVVAIMGRDS